MARKKARARVLKAGPLRFASGLQWLTNGAQASDPAQDTSTVRVDIIRPADLVALSVDAVGCELVSAGAEPAHLRPIDGFRSPRLVVRYAFQHTGEEAVYEGQTGLLLVPDRAKPAPFPTGADTPPAAPDARPNIPAGARAARASRLVFKIPAGEKIEFSTAGILAAMARLALNVHSLALPGDAPMNATIGTRTFAGASPDAVRVVLGDLIGVVGDDTITVSRARRQELRALGAPPRGTLDAILFEARELRRARTLLLTRTGVATSRALARDRPILGELIGSQPRVRRNTGTHSHPPKDDETAIEAPFRLVISPSDEARWAHVTEPAGGKDANQHVELWHSRLGNLGLRADGSPFTDERNSSRRIIRAVWARDRDRMAPADWRDPKSGLPTAGDNDPFRMSLDAADRHMLVRQSAETVRLGRQRIAPIPIAARSLWLSGLGAWLDLHGAWNSRPYSLGGIRSIIGWDHLAPMGRDQFVRVIYPGYLFPFGFQTALVKTTQRKMKDVSPSLAALYQRMTLLVIVPRRTYSDQHEFPYTEATILSLTTPPLDLPPTGGAGESMDHYFWPKVGGQPFQFIIDALDHDSHRTGARPMPLMWVAESFLDFGAINAAYENVDAWRTVPMHGHPIAFAPPQNGGDTRLATESVRLRGRASFGTSTPYMSSAMVRVPAAEVLSSPGAISIAYGDLYLDRGFANPANPGQVWAHVLVDGERAGQLTTDPRVPLPQLQFGQGAPSGSDRAGGFLTPNIPIRALSRVNGVGGDPAGMAAQKFDPAPFFKGSIGKLFGLIDLSAVTVTVDSDLLHMPEVISGFMGRIESLIEEIGRAGEAIGNAIAETDAMLASAALQDPAVRAQWIKQAQEAADTANLAHDAFDGVGDKLKDLVGLISSQGDSSAAVDLLKKQFLASLDAAVVAIEKMADKMPPVMAKLLRAIAGALKSFVLDVATLALDISEYVRGLAEHGSLMRVRFDWKPKLKSWPDGPDPLIQLKPDSLTLAIQVRTAFDGTSSMLILADLRDFTLHLFPEAELLSLRFSRFSFMVENNHKPELDIVFGGIGFHGVLSFVEGIKKLIPLDGFSDPPNLSVTAEGMTAGFSVDLPDIALGMFSITNLSLGADVQVPFFGKAMTIGFNFCSREKPFTVAVSFIGGGGWCGIRASANGLEALEVGLEAGACIAVNFGVASGSVSAMLGIYIRIESKKGSITGYFRLRGEVDVLGLISACIELYMALNYLYDTGKLVGEARITVNVSVLGFSKKVEIHAQRTFAGSNGDPSFLEVMGAESGESPAWSQYCVAFMEE